MSGDNSDTVPPDPIPNSEVKRISGDGSVGFPHVRVAHRQTPIRRKGYPRGWPFFMSIESAPTSHNNILLLRYGFYLPVTFSVIYL